jgi:hypothetical protein
MAARNTVARILERRAAHLVARIVANRARGFVKERLLVTNSQYRVQPAASAGEVRTGLGVEVATTKPGGFRVAYRPQLAPTWCSW